MPNINPHLKAVYEAEELATIEFFLMMRTEESRPVSLLGSLPVVLLSYQQFQVGNRVVRPR